MRTARRIRNFSALTALAVLVAASGCASRSYVRTQVGESADTLRASINDNAEGIEKTQLDLTQLTSDTQSADREQDQRIAETQTSLQNTEAEVAEVRSAVEGASRVANSADERSLTVARMFEDRSHLVVEESEEIYFAFASAALQPEHSETLEAVSNALNEDPNAILVLEGRTDSTGDEAFNRQLAQQRIDAARNYLVLEMGVPVYRIHGFSYGEARPDYDNEVPEEREKNRSVKLLILTPEPQTNIAALPE